MSIKLYLGIQLLKEIVYYPEIIFLLGTYLGDTYDNT